jgi:hypothetical protein
MDAQAIEKGFERIWKLFACAEMFIARAKIST